MSDIKEIKWFLRFARVYRNPTKRGYGLNIMILLATQVVRHNTSTKEKRIPETGILTMFNHDAETFRIVKVPARLSILAITLFQSAKLIS